MLIFELTYPGTWVDLPDRARAHQLGVLLHLVEGHFVDAAVALNLFVAAQQARMPVVPNRDEWERDAVRRQQLMAQFERRTGTERPVAYEEVMEKVDIELKREHWAAGSPPQQYAMRLVFLHARSFIYALDSIGKALDVLAKEPDAPPEVAVQRDAFYAAFPSLVGVRDTAHHPEDRGRGLGKRGKRLKLKPIDNQFVKAPGGGVLVLDSLNGNKYGGTMANGHYGEVEVSAESLRVVQTCIQTALNDFTWKGLRRHAPT
jgi:hypothetical protein